MDAQSPVVEHNLKICQKRERNEENDEKTIDRIYFESVICPRPLVGLHHNNHTLNPGLRENHSNRPHRNLKELGSGTSSSATVAIMDNGTGLYRRLWPIGLRH